MAWDSECDVVSDVILNEMGGGKRGKMTLTNTECLTQFLFSGTISQNDQMCMKEREENESGVEVVHKKNCVVGTKAMKIYILFEVMFLYIYVFIYVNMYTFIYKYI